MTVYIVMYILIIVVAFIEYNREMPLQDKNARFWLASATILTLVSGLRGFSVGADTENYADWFEYLKGLSWKNLFSDKTIDIEYGYRLYSYLLSKISNDPRIVIFTSSAIIIFSFLYFLSKHSDDLFISVVLFLGLNHFFTSINTYRTYLALAIIIWAYDALFKKKYIAAVLLFSLGFLFHRTTIIFSLVMIIAFILRNKRRNVIIAFVFEVALIPLIPLALNVFTSIFPKYRFYLRSEFMDDSIGKLNIVLFIIEVALIVLWFIRKDTEDPKANMHIIMLSACAVLRIVGNTIPIGFRFVQMLNFIALLVIPYNICRDKINRYIYIPSICIASFALYLYYLIANAGEIVPYTFLQ